MKRILINATQNEEIRVALCKGNHLYDFDLENRTREQKKSNIYKGHVTRVEPSLEAVFVEYGSQRQGFLPIREISAEYLSGNPRDENIKKLIKEGDELIVQVEKEERGNKGAALSTYVSLAGRYLVLMPNNPRGGGISRQISGKLREDMKRMLGNLDLPKGMSVIIRTAGIGKTQEDLQHDLNHLLNIWQAIQEQNQKYPSPRLVHQEAGVVTRAVRDYLRDDIAEIWIDNENAYVEAAGFIDAVMPKQADKLRKYTDYEPMFSRFNVEKQIETAYHREVRLPSGGSIVIDQTEALVSIDINSAKSTKGSDVAETAYHTNLEAADEIARQLRLRDMGGLIVIDFIDMNDNKHQKEVEKRLVDATKYDRARVQFGEISKFGLMEMSRQRLRPSLEESTGYICPRCHGNGMIRDLRSLSLSIMRQIEQIALKERQGEVQAEVPTDIAAFILNEKRDSLVYLEQDSGTRITILPHAHLESPNFKLHYNRDGFAPTSYERITDTQQQEHSDLGYNVDWQTAEKERPEQQPTRQPRKAADNQSQQKNEARSQPTTSTGSSSVAMNKATANSSTQVSSARAAAPSSGAQSNQPSPAPVATQLASAAQPQAVAWLSNLFAQAPQAQATASVSSRDAAEAIEALVNTGAQSLGSFGQVDNSALSQTQSAAVTQQDNSQQPGEHTQAPRQSNGEGENDDKRRRKSRKPRPSKPRQRREQRDDNEGDSSTANGSSDRQTDSQDKREHDNKRSSERGRSRQSNERNGSDRNGSERTTADRNDDHRQDSSTSAEPSRAKRKPHSKRDSRGKLERGETLTAATDNGKQSSQSSAANNKAQPNAKRSQDPNEVTLQVNVAPAKLKAAEVVHLSLDDSKAGKAAPKDVATQANATNVVATDKPSDTPNRSDSKPAAQTSAPVSETKAETATADKAESISQPSTAKESQATNSKASDSSATEQEPVAAKADAPESTVDTALDTTADAKATDSHNAAEATVSTDTSSADKSADFTLTHDEFFAERYVTAEKFGQASNDPRVVRQQQSAATVDVSAQAQTSAPAIRGTVGAFIRAALTDAESRLQNDGVISCFIAAIDAQAQQTKPADDNAKAAVDNGEFDFSNYGYEPLSADYIARFDAMTQAVSQFALAQGKTEVEPRAISKRASNDPRGQHPDYQEVAVLSVENVQPEQHSQETQQQADSASEAEGSETKSPGTKSPEGESPETDSNELSKAVTNEASADELQADTTQDSSEVAADEVEADALSSQQQADDISAESEHLLEVEQADNDESAKEDASGKSKTTIASYKNMIENVAEQLLPQTGMFSLTTPKVPKARSRKPKAEHKKPSQAEKAESEHSDSDS